MASTEDQAVRVPVTSAEQPIADESAEVELTEPHTSESRRAIVTYWLLALLTFLIVGHYACVMIMEWNGKKYEGISNAFTNALPAISGLVGTAVGYYFARSRGGSE